MIDINQRLFEQAIRRAIDQAIVDGLDPEVIRRLREDASHRAFAGLESMSREPLLDFMDEQQVLSNRGDKVLTANQDPQGEVRPPVA